MTVTRESLRQELNDLQARMKRYEEFKSNQYSETICKDDEHQWQDNQPTVYSHYGEMVMSRTCVVCGLTMNDTYTRMAAFADDHWAEFREGDEEE